MFLFTRPCSRHSSGERNQRLVDRPYQHQLAALQPEQHRDHCLPGVAENWILLLGSARMGRSQGTRMVIGNPGMENLSYKFYRINQMPCSLAKAIMSQDVLVSLSSSLGHKRWPGVYVFYLWFILLCKLRVTLFRLISLQSMRFVSFSVGIHIFVASS